MGPDINEVQQSEGGNRVLIATTSSEVNVVPVSMAPNSDLNGREQFRPNPAEAVLEKSPDIVEFFSSSRKGKRRMTDREDDTNAHVPAIDGGFKRNRIMTIAEDDSDIEYIGTWRPPSRKPRTKNVIQTAVTVKTENLPIKLETVSDLVVSAKSY